LGTNGGKTPFTLGGERGVGVVILMFKKEKWGEGVKKKKKKKIDKVGGDRQKTPVVVDRRYTENGCRKTWKAPTGNFCLKDRGGGKKKNTPA